MKSLRALSPLLILVAIPAKASSPAIDLPAGRLGDAVLALGRQTGTSIAVEDKAIWERRVPALRGRMATRRALEQLARQVGAEVQSAGPRGWRLVARRPGPVPPRASAPPARHAAPPQEPDQRDIVVTASKRGVRLFDYAGQVSLIRGEDLQFGSTGGTDAIAARLASLSSTYLGAGRNKLFIRGIADSSFTGPTQSTVGQYLGDLRLSYNAPDPDLRLYDMTSAEVLEGPQGTLYGAGSLGGIIRMIPQPPEQGQTAGWLQGGGSATQHGAPGADLAGGINLPIVGDSVAFRGVGYGITEGGYIDNPLLGKKDINRTDIWGGRATLRFRIGDDWTIDVGGVAQQVHGDDSQNADRNGPGLTRRSPVDQGFDASYALGQFVVAGDWGDLHFKSSAGLVRQRLLERYDATVAAGLVVPGTGRLDAPLSPGAVISTGAPRVFVQHNTTDMFATETRLWRPMTDDFGWVVGASFTANRTRLDRTIGPIDQAMPATGVMNRIDELTFYGEASAEPINGLVLSAGGRFSTATLSGEGEQVEPLVALAGKSITTPRHETSFLPSASLVVKLRPGLSAYGRFQQGFRPGGLAIEGNFVRQFRGDRVSTEEVGFRLGEPRRDRFDLAANVSHTRWNNIQADFIDSSGLPSTANIGDGRIWTFSAAGGWVPLPGLRLDAGFTFNASKVTNALPQALLATAASNRVPNIARFAVRAGFDYRRPLHDDVTLQLNGWARYVGPSRLGIGPELGDEQGNYLDTALNLRIGRPALGVTVGLTNLTDSVGNRFAFGTPFTTGRSQITPLRPRTIRIGVDAAF